jgi:hypothetical protein
MGGVSWKHTVASAEHDDVSGAVTSKWCSQALPKIWSKLAEKNVVLRKVAVDAHRSIAGQRSQQAGVALRNVFKTDVGEIGVFVASNLFRPQLNQFIKTDSWKVLAHR